VAERTIEASTDRATSLRRAVLFTIACAPIWLLPQRFAVFHPVAMLGVVLGATFLFLWWDRRSPSVLGLDLRWRRLAELAGGLAGGALFIAAVALLLRVVLPFEWERNPAFFARLALDSLLYLLFANSVEELVFRGYSFERLIATIGHWPAQLVTALLFAVFHLVNGWPWQAAFTGTVIGSVLFGLVFVRWGSVPAAVGVHAATNWTRDLLLLDPPNMRTLYAPVAGRNWTSAERLTTAVAFDAIAILACVLLWWSIVRHNRRLAK
jgi:membrane protease YdiL (CAAX protease family)